MKYIGKITSITHTSETMDRSLAYAVFKIAENGSVSVDQASELKKQFVRISRLIHPDKCPKNNAKEAFQVVEKRNVSIKIVKPC